MTRHFTDADVRAVLTYEALIPAMEKALGDFSSGSVVQPVRATIPVAENGGYLFVMPAYAQGANALGAKLVSYFPKNAGIDTHFATIQLFNHRTGEPLASMDGSLITEMRTAAVSAVATDRLAQKDAAVLALVGAGVQARSHLAALRKVRAFREVRVWSPNSAAAFAREHGVIATASAEACVRGADVIVVATTSAKPVVHGAWVKDGAHVNSVGAALPDWRELDDEFIHRAKIFVDSRAGAFAESGDVRAVNRVDAEIGEVVLGSHPGRQSSNDVTWFKSLGMAVEDVVAAGLVLNASAAK